MTDEAPVALARILAQARRLAAAGQDEGAKQAYVQVLGIDATHFGALNELGTLALVSGHRSAARSAYRQAVRCHPDNPLGRVNLGNVYLEDDDLSAARAEYTAALASNPAFPEAHQGIARTLDALGEPAAAEAHWRLGFAGRPLVVQRYRGTAAPVRVLLLVSTRFGNIATRLFLDDRTFEVSAIYVDYWDEAWPLPSHEVVFNAVGDADLCASTLRRAAALTLRTAAPIINVPAQVATTGRLENARRLAAVPGLVAPAVRWLARDASGALPDWRFPLLLRTPGHHMGQHFVRVENRQALPAAVAGLPGEQLLAIEYLDSRGADGLVRKYRVMCIGGVLYPLHLAISSDWKVHYFSAAMATSAVFREEERRFLESMSDVLGVRALAALSGIFGVLGLDYAGIDFGLSKDGSVLLYEANATMVIVPPPPEPHWDYRRASLAAALEAARQLVLRRAGRESVPIAYGTAVDSRKL
jgi:hypothetical protein